MIWPWACQCIAWAAVESHVPHVRVNSCGWAAHVGFQHGAILVLGAGKIGGRTSQQSLEIQTHSLAGALHLALVAGSRWHETSAMALAASVAHSADKKGTPGFEPGTC